MTISEQQIDIPFPGHNAIPCSMWSSTDKPNGVVLLGHGLGVDRFDSTVRRPVEILAQEHNAMVVVPEIPLHGDRADLPYNTPDIVERWQQFWVSGGIDLICQELNRVATFCEELFGQLPIAYFGLSLGTQYGIPFLAQSQNIRSAALGLFGSKPAPKTPVMNKYAPAIRCPVYFVQKLDDEIHPAATTTHLYSILGSSEKFLDSTSGKHRETSIKSIREACKFMCKEGNFHVD